MRLGRNLAAGLGHAAVATLVGIAAVPFYIHYLGVEAYGLIGFHLTLQGVLQLLDMGLGPAISREVARGQAQARMGPVRDLLHSFAWLYWGAAVLIAAAFLVAAPLIAARWLDPGALGEETVGRAVLLMGLLIALRFPSGLYYGALTGAHRLTVASALASAAILLGNGGAIAVLAFASPTIEAFFLWQAGVAILYTLAIRHAAWRAVGGRRGARFDHAGLAGIWRFALGLGVLAATGTVFTQLDKLLLSRFVGLAEFGHYMLATVLAGLLYRLVTPLFNVMYPRFSALVAAGEIGALTRLYRAGGNLFATFWFPAALALALAAEPLVLVWTGDAGIAARTAPLLALLAIGSALHGVMYFPYALQLAYGRARLPLAINLILLAVQLPLVVVLAMRLGALGAAISWLVLHLLYLLLGTWMTHRRLLPGIGRLWLVGDIGLPLATTGAIGMLAVPIVAAAAGRPLLQILAAAGAAAAALLISAALSPYRPAEIRAALAA